MTPFWLENHSFEFRSALYNSQYFTSKLHLNVIVSR